MSKYWGYHLRINAAKCKLATMTGELGRQNIYNFTKKLVNDIDMVAYGEPQIIHFGSDDKSGYTLIQLIETSNIAAHFVDQNGNAYLDVFSCKPFDVDVVIALMLEFFAPEAINYDFTERDADNVPTDE